MSKIRMKSLIEIIGTQRILVENYLGLISYDSNQIVIRTHFENICVKGENLMLRFMHSERLVITGNIFVVLFGAEIDNA